MRSTPTKPVLTEHRILDGDADKGKIPLPPPDCSRSSTGCKSCTKTVPRWNDYSTTEDREFHLKLTSGVTWGFQVALVVRNPLASAGDMNSIPMSGRSPGGGHGNPLQCSCLENSRDGGAWWAAIYGVTQSQARLKRLSSSSSSSSSSGVTWGFQVH